MQTSNKNGKNVTYWRTQHQSIKEPIHFKVIYTYIDNTNTGYTTVPNTTDITL